MRRAVRMPGCEGSRLEVGQSQDPFVEVLVRHHVEEEPGPLPRPRRLPPPRTEHVLGGRPQPAAGQHEGERALGAGHVRPAGRGQCGVGALAPEPGLLPVGLREREGAVQHEYPVLRGTGEPRGAARGQPQQREGVTAPGGTEQFLRPGRLRAVPRAGGRHPAPGSKGPCVTRHRHAPSRPRPAGPHKRGGRSPRGEHHGKRSRTRKSGRVVYSTVTDFARLRGLSMSRPSANAVW